MASCEPEQTLASIRPDQAGLVEADAERAAFALVESEINHCLGAGRDMLCRRR